MRRRLIDRAGNRHNAVLMVTIRDTTLEPRGLWRVSEGSNQSALAVS